MERTVVYVDGESHYHRSVDALCHLHGNGALLRDLKLVTHADNRSVLVIPEANVFWLQTFVPDARRKTYVTSASGDSQKIHEMKLRIRSFGLEPHVIHERTDLRKRRDNTRDTLALIEKPKGVDIALATRMVDEAHRHLFDICHVYTSDVDFLPAIELVKSLGRQVFVHGYKSGLSRQSELLCVPDQFVDLVEVLREDCELLAPD